MVKSAVNELSEKTFSDIAAIVYQVCGINLTEAKKELVKARIGKIIRERDLEGFDDYFSYLSSDTTGEAINELINAISTNLTYFFREQSHFDFMKNTMIPQLIKNINTFRDYALRGWSAGCSSGAEPYSLALTLANEIPQMRSIDLKILATDIDTNMLNTASGGIYPAGAVKPVSSDMLRAFFRRSKDCRLFKIKREIRDIVVFRFLNLIGDFPFKKQFDFIFCRNVMIYFDKLTQEVLVNKFYANLKPGGYLFIGHSEGLSGLRHDFTYIKPTIYQKK